MPRWPAKTTKTTKAPARRVNKGGRPPKAAAPKLLQVGDCYVMPSMVTALEGALDTQMCRIYTEKFAVTATVNVHAAAKAIMTNTPVEPAEVEPAPEPDEVALDDTIPAGNPLN